MEGKKRTNKRSKHTGGKVATGAVLLALLLAGGHYGLGIGRDGDGLLTGQALENANQTVTQDASKAEEASKTEEKQQMASVGQPQEATEAQEAGTIVITVQEDKLLYQGEEVTLSALEEGLLKDYRADASTVKLEDDHAIKAAYDEVIALLQKLNIPYAEEK